ncbi:hypothetical protein EcCFBP13530_10215 [Enterobacter cancerogenus]|uniref:Uncharacterized protein n=1 Tax=Enterobacter cancerogenus TaxID=69218 RepID=A0AB38P8J8_9ENTR|nr:hypothetical protein [Enterobacter cancerogenus]TKK20885.1 hypothetical protein EcCFBP13530_10215 [Enterobacter cancerogenus]
MNKDFIASRIDEIDNEMALLRYQPCQCELYLEIKVREFGGGVHYVRQCNQCGTQKGGALKANEALCELNGESPKPFDPIIAERYDNESFNRNQKLTKLSQERFKLIANFDEKAESFYLTEQNKFKEAYQLLSEHIDSFKESFDIDKALIALYRQEMRLKKEKQETLSENTSLFSSEPELKAWMSNFFKNDFYIYPEVTGIHNTEKVKVRIDYVLFPRKHLVDSGFEAMPFGIEVKYFNQVKDFAHKASRGVWQAISYNDCEFSLQGRNFKLKFCLLFSNLSFSNERETLEIYSDHFDGKVMKWMGMLNVANHAKVGVLKVIGKKDRVKGWTISFAGGNYFNCSINNNESIYKLSNANTINKVRIGNF